MKSSDSREQAFTKMITREATILRYLIFIIHFRTILFKLLFTFQSFGPRKVATRLNQRGLANVLYRDNPTIWISITIPSFTALPLPVRLCFWRYLEAHPCHV